MQHKTQRPVQFEITRITRDAVQKWFKQAGLKSEGLLFPIRVHGSPHLGTRRYPRTLESCVEEVGLDTAAFRTQSLRRTIATLLYRRTQNQRAVQLQAALNCDGQAPFGSGMSMIGVSQSFAREIPHSFRWRSRRVAQDVVTATQGATMKRPFFQKFAAATVLIGGILGASVAQARPEIQATIGLPGLPVLRVPPLPRPFIRAEPVYVQPRPVYEPSPVVVYERSWRPSYRHEVERDRDLRHRDWQRREEDRRHQGWDRSTHHDRLGRV